MEMKEKPLEGEGEELQGQAVGCIENSRKIQKHSINLFYGKKVNDLLHFPGEYRIV